MVFELRMAPCFFKMLKISTVVLPAAQKDGRSPLLVHWCNQFAVPNSQVGRNEKKRNGEHSAIQLPRWQVFKCGGEMLP